VQQIEGAGDIWIGRARDGVGVEQQELVGIDQQPFKPGVGSD
jgi:hypothetical protein